MHPRLWLLVCMGWCMVWTLSAQASWEEYQQAGEAAYNRGDYATAQRMFLAAVREARNFGPQDPRLDISLSKLELLRVTQSVHNKADVRKADVRTQRVTKKKSHTRKSGSVRRGHRRQPARPGVRQARPGRQRHAVQSARPGERRKGTRTTVARPAPRAKRQRATLHRTRPARHATPPVRHGKRREVVHTPRHRRETPRRQQSHTLQRSRTTHHQTEKTTGKPRPARSRHK
jgi:hypothetical protein